MSIVGINVNSKSKRFNKIGRYDENDNHVLNWADNDFDINNKNFINKHGKPVAIMVFSEYCPYCIAKKALWNDLPSIQPNYNFAMVDANDNRVISNALNVDSVPAFFWQDENGTLYPVDGDIINEMNEVYNE